jgi:hypothetical protein
MTVAIRNFKRGIVGRGCEKRELCGMLSHSIVSLRLYSIPGTIRRRRLGVSRSVSGLHYSTFTRVAHLTGVTAAQPEVRAQLPLLEAAG